MSDWERLQFLLGDWVNPLSGQPGQGVSGESTFEYRLDRKIMLRTSRAEFQPRPGEDQGLVHTDLLIIHQQPGFEGLKAIYFDNEGHVIHYSLIINEEPGSVTFESQETASSPRARLTYTSHLDGSLHTEFLVASPGGQLLSHVKGTLRRK